jgi:hypothetical protein
MQLYIVNKVVCYQRGGRQLYHSLVKSAEYYQFAVKFRFFPGVSQILIFLKMVVTGK